MSVIKLVTAEPDKSVVKFLRDLADEIERNVTTPNKAVVILHTDLAEKFDVSCRFCNASVIERTGIMHIALQDSIDG